MTETIPKGVEVPPRGAPEESGGKTGKEGTPHPLQAKPARRSKRAHDIASPGTFGT